MSLIPLVEKDCASEAQAAILAQIPPLNLFKALLNSPGLTTLLAQLGGNILYATKLESRVREAAILRVAHLTGCSYEIAHHDRIGRDVGLSDTDLAALAGGDHQAVDTPLGLAMRWVDGVLREGRAAPDLVREVIETMGAEQTIELSVTIGYYTMLAQILASFEIPVESGSAPIFKIDERPAALG